MRSEDEVTDNGGIEIDFSGLNLDPEPQAILLEMPKPAEPPPMRIEVAAAPQETDEALVAALSSLNERIQATDARQVEIIEIVKELAQVVSSDREQLAASLDALTAAILEQPAPVVNIPAFPEIPAPVVNVAPPSVNVRVDPPSSNRKLSLKRDPITNMIASAEIEEVRDGG